ncbi:MAG TPA: CBS domain-containing protein [archaeon]|nr:CBS domain-containing protein [archaeon]
METVSDLLRMKGSQVLTIYGNKTVEDAIATLVEHNVGSLLVLGEQHEIVGIITERDILRKCYHKGPDIAKMKVNEAMTGKDELIVSLPEDRLDYILQVMTQNRIRHIPVVDGANLLGILSIGDVVKAQLAMVRTENHYLRDYLGDKYPG